MINFLTQNSDIILKLGVAVVLGMLIGVERLFVHKAAGMKTHALVSMGSALFIIISEMLAQKYGAMSGFNAAMIASQIVVGIGFLGAGVIIFNKEESRLLGLTTASGLWATAGIGMASGFGFFGLAVISTIFVLFVLIVMNLFEKPIREISNHKESTNNN